MMPMNRCRPGSRSLAERRGRKRRLAIVGGAVVGAMTLGAGAVAASSEDFRHSVSQTVGVIFQTPGHGAPAPEHVQPSPSAVPALPAPAATPRHGTPGTPGVLPVRSIDVQQLQRPGRFGQWKGAARHRSPPRPPSAATASCQRPGSGL